MKSRYLRPLSAAVLTVLSVAGLLLFVEEYAKSYLRNTVKDEVLSRDDSDDVVYEVPAGDFLSVNGEENADGGAFGEGLFEIAGYCKGAGGTEDLHLIGIINIPELDIEEPVWEENTNLAMRYGVILMKDSARPGQKGNSIIVGHRNTITHTVFDKLPLIKNGDAVTITTPDGLEQNYRVNGTYYCSPYDLQNYVGASADHPVMITLITCAREKGNSWRFIVTLIPSDS